MAVLPRGLRLGDSARLRHGLRDVRGRHAVQEEGPLSNESLRLILLSSFSHVTPLNRPRTPPDMPTIGEDHVPEPDLRDGRPGNHRLNGCLTSLAKLASSPGKQQQSVQVVNGVTSPYVGNDCAARAAIWCQRAKMRVEHIFSSSNVLTKYEDVNAWWAQLQRALYRWLKVKYAVLIYARDKRGILPIDIADQIVGGFLSD